MMRYQRRAALRCARAYPTVHRSALLDAAGVTENGSADTERDLRDVVRYIKDIGEFEFYAVYERPGWYTRIPTEAIRQIAEWESLKRNRSEQARNLRVLEFRKGTALHAVVYGLDGYFDLMMGMLAEQLPEPDREPDECLIAIDELIADGRLAG
jgi:hypothetical protein